MNNKNNTLSLERWIKISQDSRLKNRNEKGEFERLMKEKTKYESQIDRDVPRTFPSAPLFNITGQARLKRILKAYAVYNPKVGYVQGMNSIVGYFLNRFGDKDEDSTSALKTDRTVFWIVVAILHLQKYDLLGLYLPEFPKLHCAAYQLDRLMKRKAPRLVRHFKHHKIEPTMYLCKWLLTMYSNLLPQKSQDTMWNNFMERGWTYLVRLTFVLIINEESKLLSMNSMYSVASYLSTNMWTQEGAKTKLEEAVKYADNLQITDHEIKDTEFQYLIKASTLQCSDVLMKERESLEALEIEQAKKNGGKKAEGLDLMTGLGVGAALVLGIAAVAISSARQRRR